MKKNNIKLLILSIVLVVAMVGCRPVDRNMRNLSTQTRVRDNNVNNRFMDNNAPLNTRDNLGTNLNNGMVRNNDGITGVNDGRMGNNNTTNDLLRNDTRLNNNTNRLNNNLSTNLSGTPDRATAIAQRVTALPEISNASVLISGNTAIVGCDVDVNGNTNNTITAALKQKVEAAVKVADKNIQNVSVTSDPNIHSRIKTMSTDMNNGNPVKSFTQDIEDIMRQITNVR